MNFLVKILTPIFSMIKIPAEVIPIGLMRSISGGGALGFLTDIFNDNGPDSFIGKVASTIMGASDTTLYVLAIYTSAVGISKEKFTLFVGLFCDLIAFLIATWIWQLQVLS